MMVFHTVEAMVRLPSSIRRHHDAPFQTKKLKAPRKSNEPEHDR